MEQNSIINFLTSAVPFNYLAQDLLETIISYGEVIDYTDQETILQQGKQGHGLYVLLEGEAEVTTKLPGTGNFKLARLKPGKFFGEVNLMRRSPCTATVTSLGNTSCFVLNKQGFDAIYISCPQARYKITQAMTEAILMRQEAILAQIKILSTKRTSFYDYSANKKSGKTLIPFKNEEKQKKFFHLHELPVFSNFSREEFHDFLNYVSVIECSGRTQLITARENTCSAFFILKGAVRVSSSEAKHESKFAVFGPNTLCCVTSLIDQKNPKFIYTTCEEAVFFEISQAQQLLMQENKLIWYKFYDIACKHIISLQQKLNTQLIRLTSEKNILPAHLMRK